MRVLNLGAASLARMRVPPNDPYELDLTRALQSQQVREEIQHLRIVERLYWDHSIQCAGEVTKYAKLATQCRVAIQRLSESAWEQHKRQTL